MTTGSLEHAMAPATTAPAGGDPRSRMRFAFLAETSRCLSDSLDLETTLAAVAGIALPQFGVWGMVDIVAPDDSISRVAVIHPDAAKQSLARDFFQEHPPCRDDPIGAPRVIRTNHSEFALVEGPALLDQIDDAEQRDLLRQLGAQSFLIVAMRARGRTLGAITFVSDTQREYDDADLLLAEDLGRRCAMAIDNARTYGLAQEARRGAEEAREAATFAAQRANALRELADSAREEAETANRAKATFLTTMSHEFRTPLAAILGFVGLINDGLAGPLTSLQRDYIRRIGNASGNLLRLIEEVLTLSQVHAGRGTMHVEHIDLGASVREVAELLQLLVEAKKLRLVVDVPQTPLLFPTDEAKFRQIVINLTSNAVKFTSMGEVRVSLHRDEEGVVLRVRDTGEVISAEDAERLFESFMQAGPSGSRRSQGTGLGLAISRQLARLMGGDVTVESAPDRGSRFTLRLPYSAEATAAGDAARTRTESACSNTSTPRFACSTALAVHFFPEWSNESVRVFPRVASDRSRDWLGCRCRLVVHRGPQARRSLCRPLRLHCCRASPALARATWVSRDAAGAHRRRFRRDVCYLVDTHTHLEAGARSTNGG